MTAKKPPKRKPPHSKVPSPKDAAQSKRFAEKVRELEAAGELSPTDAAEAFERAFKIVVPPKKP